MLHDTPLPCVGSGSSYSFKAGCGQTETLSVKAHPYIGFAVQFTFEAFQQFDLLSFFTAVCCNPSALVQCLLSPLGLSISIELFFCTDCEELSCRPHTIVCCPLF